MIGMILTFVLYSAVYSAIEGVPAPPEVKTVPGITLSLECYKRAREIINNEASELPGGEADSWERNFDGKLTVDVVNTLGEMLVRWADDQLPRDSIELQWVKDCKEGVVWDDE